MATTSSASACIQKLWDETSASAIAMISADRMKSVRIAPDTISASCSGLPNSAASSAKLSSVQKHLALTGHVYSPTVILLAPKFWDSLSDAQKALFASGAREGATAMRKYVDDVEKTGVDELKAQGMQVTEISNKAPFQQALAPAYSQYATKYGKDLIDRIGNTR